MLTSVTRWYSWLASWRRRPSRRRPPRSRPALEWLEGRLVPAHNLAIDFAATADVLVDDQDQVRTFTATSDNAVLNVTDIQAAFDAGFHVVVSTGDGGGSTGNIEWRAGVDAYFSGSADFPRFRTLTLRTDPLDSGRHVDIQANLFGFPDNNSPFFGLHIDTGGPDGAVTLQQVDVAGGPLVVTSGAAGIVLHGDLSTHGGDLRLTGDVLLENSVALTTNDGLSPFALDTVYLVGTVDGAGDLKDLRITASNVSLDADLGGVRHQLGNLTVVGGVSVQSDRVVTVQGQFTLAEGKLELAAHELMVHTGQFVIGDGFSAAFATLSGVGTVRADQQIQVAANGVVSPGGLHFPGTLHIDGDIAFQRDSKFVVDLDVFFNATGDNLHATGTITLDAGAMLYGGDGVLGGSALEILTADDGLTGTFANTMAPIGLAADVVAVTYSATAVRLEPAPPPSRTQVRGVAADGTLYSIRLAGGGPARLQVVETFKVGGSVEYVPVFQKVTFTAYETVSRLVAEQRPVVGYETVAVDTGTTTVFVTNPVLRLVDTEVMITELVPVQREKEITVQMPVEREAFVRSLDIQVDGGTRANRLRIATTANGGFGTLDVGSVRVSGELGALAAPTTTLGALSVEGALGKVTLNRLTGPMDTGGNRSQHTAIDIAQIAGSITTGSVITLLASHQVGEVTITAPRIGRLTVTGDCNASLVLDAGFRSALALGSVRIDGGISNSVWSIRGSVGPVTVRQRIDQWFVGNEFGPALQGVGNTSSLGNIASLRLGEVQQASITASGRIGTLTAASWEGFQIQARTLGTLNVAGAFATNLVLDAGLSTARALDSATLGSVSGNWNIRGSLGAVTVVQDTVDWSLGGRIGAVAALDLGEVRSAFIAADGHIGTLSGHFTAATRHNTTIQAGSIGALTATGDFSANLVLDAGDESALALRSAHLERIGDSVWDIRGSLGTIAVDDSATGWQLGTQEDGVAQHPDGLGGVRELRVGLLHDSAIQTVGRIGSLRAEQWQVTDMTARSLGALHVERDFLFSDVTLTGASRQGVGLDRVVVGGRVWESTFNVLAGAVTAFTCGRFQHSGLFVGYDASNSRFLDPWNLGTFTTTSLPAVPHQSDPRTDAYQDSWIVANRFGEVTLTGVSIANGGQSFGLQVNGAENAGQVKATTLPFEAGVNLQPNSTMGDFVFLA